MAIGNIMIPIASHVLKEIIRMVNNMDIGNTIITMVTKQNNFIYEKYNKILKRYINLRFFIHGYHCINNINFVYPLRLVNIFF